MTPDRATGINTTRPTDNEPTDLIAQLLRRVDALKAETERLRGEFDETHEQHRADRHALARENHDLRRSYDNLQNRVAKAEEKDGYLLDDIVDLEAQLTDIEATAPGVGTQTAGDDSMVRSPALTPIERVSMLDTEDVCIDVTPSIERAVAIFDHWPEWSTKTPKGRVLKEGLKTLLRTATGEQLAWRQVYRAAEALEELSKGRIRFFDHARHGKMLIEPTPKNRDCHASSAATP